MKSALLKNALTVLRQRGLVAEVEQGGAHFKVRFVNPLGRQCILIVSRSPSSRNAGKRNEAQLRRLLRAPHHRDRNSHHLQPKE